MKKLLIIRFSSFGDIVQCMNVLDGIARAMGPVEIHWAVRQDATSLVERNPLVNKVWSFDRTRGLLGLIKFGLQLRKEKFDFVYDAHSNLRSSILSKILKPCFFTGPKLIRRSKERLKRFLLFYLGINKFPKPYRGMVSYRAPLAKWGVDGNIGEQSWNFGDSSSIDKNPGLVFCPSAAWEMKRWPIDHWKKLIQILEGKKITLLGGPDDTFCEELVAVAPERVNNLAGKLSLLDSCQVVSHADIVVSADTGLIHVAEILGKKGISLMGPSAFGFASRPNIQTMEVELSCRPCSKDGRGKCSQSVWQKCMVDITPESVAEKIKSNL